MSGVAGEQDAPDPPLVGDAGMESVDSTAFDLDPRIVHVWSEQASKRFVAHQCVTVFAGQLHELPAHPRANGRQLNGRPARVAKEGDLVDAVVLDAGVDDEPALE